MKLDTTPGVMTATRGGLVPTPPNDATKFLDGTGGFSVPVGSGSGGITLGTEQASTSGTSIDFTGIPSTAKQIYIMFSGVSTNGTSPIIIQIGDSGGIETSGYLGGGSYATSVVGAANYTTGFGTTGNSSAATVVRNGQATLTLMRADTFKWCCTSIMGQSDSAATLVAGGIKATSAALDRVRITTVNGADTFDAGVINIAYQ